MSEELGFLLGMGAFFVGGMLFAALGAREVRDAARARGEAVEPLHRFLALIDLTPSRSVRLPAALMRRPPRKRD